MKRIISIQDISCVGKCSLTVALPIISAMGIETSVVPTAVLSTHTQFSGFTFRDLTDDMQPIMAHWKKEGLCFDAIYTGYLGSFRQLDIVSEYICAFSDKATVIIDPVMGDCGKLYKGFTPEFAKSMGKLCSKADVIVPNLTEASYMLGIPYAGDNYDEKYIIDLLRKLHDLCKKTVVLTGVSLEEGRLGVMSLDENDKLFFYDREKLPAAYHGTGDIFASAFTGAVTGGFTTEEALKIAVDYTVECIRITLEDNDRRDYGVDFESAIPYLIKRIGK